jgi:hypothetical protein
MFPRACRVHVGNDASATHFDNIGQERAAVSEFYVDTPTNRMVKVSFTNMIDRFNNGIP